MGNHESSWGYNVQGLTATQAGVGLALLPRLDEINAQRRRKAALLQAAISRSRNLQTLTIDKKAQPIFLRFPLLAASEEERESLYEALWAAGIGAGRLYEKSLPAIFTPGSQVSFPGAEAIAGRLLTLPTHHQVTGDDIRHIGAIVSA
jgi:dTDP-4-amino-4,6-dideoxygalactose transaminase